MFYLFVLFCFFAFFFQLSFSKEKQNKTSPEPLLLGIKALPYFGSTFQLAVSWTLTHSFTSAWGFCCRNIMRDRMYASSSPNPYNERKTESFTKENMTFIFQFLLEVTVNTVCKLITLTKHKNRLHPKSTLFYFEANLQAVEVWQTQVRKHAKCRTVLTNPSFFLFISNHISSSKLKEPVINYLLLIRNC